MSDFLTYSCDECDAPYCERVYIMNLALGNVEDAFCLSCLAKEYEQSLEMMAKTCWGYVSARDCFKDPWLKIDNTACPQKTSNSCYCDLS